MFVFSIAVFHGLSDSDLRSIRRAFLLSFMAVATLTVHAVTIL